MGFTGVTAIEVSAAPVTVSCADPLIFCDCVEVAVIVMGPPAESAEATPDELIVAMAVFDDIQFSVTGPVELSEKCPVAVKVCVAPIAIVAVVGATVIEVKIGGAAVTDS